MQQMYTQKLKIESAPWCLQYSHPFCTCPVVLLYMFTVGDSVTGSSGSNPKHVDYEI